MRTGVTVVFGITIGLVIGYFVAVTMFGTSSDRATTGNSSVSMSQSVKGQFDTYRAGVIGSGKPAVLFFHADWSPVSREADLELRALYDKGTPTVNMYRANFDTETELKKTYRVTKEPTFVLVDGEGKAKGIVQGYAANLVAAFTQ